MTKFTAIAWLVAALASHQPEKPASHPSNPTDPPATTPSTVTPPPTPNPADEIRQTWGTRLEALTPERPMDYFLLGEEVAADAEENTSRDLARQLFVLAYELDAKRGTSREALKFGPSVCLALASIASRDDERRWLRALAETMSDRTPGVGQTATERSSSYPLEAAFDLATAMGMARAGEGRRAEQLLDKPETVALLDQVDSVPTPNGTTSDLRQYLKRAVRDWPVCPQCRNRRVVPAGASRHGEMILCDTCRGNPGPKMTEAELGNHLRIESMLLQGTQRSWAAQVLFDDGAPLRDLDPDELTGTYGVDVAKPLWRNGQWVAAATSAAPPAAPPKASP